MNKSKPELLVKPGHPAVAPTKDTEGIPEQADSSNQEEIDTWEENNDKALGSIFLRLSPDIQAKYRDVDNAKDLIEQIQTEYGKPGVMGVYSEFKKIMETHIPADADPIPAVDKMFANFSHLTENKADIPEFLKAMIILAKVPPTYEYLTQILCQADSVSDVKASELKKMLRLAWEQKTTNAKPKQQANKLSAVKQASGQPQEFSQQQQTLGPQRGGFCGRGRGKRGKRRSGKNSQQQLQQQQLQAAEQPPYQQQQFQSFTPHPSQLPSPPPPQWVQVNPPPVHPNTMGYFASTIKARRPLPPTPPVNPETGFYGNTFGKALNLAHRLGVTPTTETVKTLEQTVVARKTCDPHPNKRARRDSLPRGEPQGSKGKARASNDDEVSLDFTDDEPAGPLFSEEECGAEDDDGDYQGYQIDDTMDYDVEGEFAQTGFEPDFS